MEDHNLENMSQGREMDQLDRFLLSQNKLLVRQLSLLLRPEDLLLNITKDRSSRQSLQSNVVVTKVTI